MGKKMQTGEYNLHLPLMTIKNTSPPTVKWGGDSWQMSVIQSFLAICKYYLV